MRKPFALKDFNPFIQIEVVHLLFKDHNGKQKNILTIFKGLQYDFTNMIATFSNFMVQQLFVIMNNSINKKKQTSREIMAKTAKTNGKQRVL